MIVPPARPMSSIMIRFGQNSGGESTFLGLQNVALIAHCMLKHVKTFLSDVTVDGRLGKQCSRDANKCLLYLSLQLLPDLPTIPAAMIVQFFVPYCCTNLVRVRSCNAYFCASVRSGYECLQPNRYACCISLLQLSKPLF